MKKLVLIVGLLAPVSLLAQVPSGKPDQYCGLQTVFKARNKYNLTLLTGVDPSQAQQEEVTYIKSIDNEFDALNYLSSHGWEVIGVNDLPGGARYYFRRHQQ